jgi:photosystem II stability/assembly factor-like uncharacterized protein/uncharacterized caspase-like protein
MCNRRCPWTFLIALIISEGLSCLLLYSQTATSQRAVQDVTPASPSSIQPGPYFALVIGNNNYKYLPKLQTSVNDANAVARLLQDRYGFRTTVLLNADRVQILTALVDFRRTLPEDSNLLIYYAGHGQHDRDTDEAYWLPVDALADNNANWISADDITRNVRAVPSSHILIISDSCYSGFLSGRNAEAAINPKERSYFLAKMLKSKSRNLMSSGGDEPVADNGAPGHSVFAAAVLDSLGEMDDDTFTAASLFQRYIQPRVGGRSDQVPQYSWIRNSGHDGGDFVFFRMPHGSLRSSGDSSAISPALDPGRRTFVVFRDLTVASNGRGCKLTPGDVITRLTDIPESDGTVNVSVTASQKTDCSYGQTVAIKIEDLEEMQNHFQEQLNEGLTALANKQAAQQTPGRTARTDSNAQRIVPSAQSNVGWAVGDEGTILHTDDGGSSWKPQISGTSEKLNSVTFVTSRSGWAVGGGGVILHTQDGGGTWKSQFSGTSKFLLSVAFATTQSGWAGGIDGLILHTQDGGLTWRQQSSGIDENINSLAFATPQSGWAAGRFGTMLRTTNGGVNWNPHKLAVFLNSVAFATPQSGWAVGSTGTVLHSDDAGTSWQILRKPSGSEMLNSIAFATSQSAWAAGGGTTILHTEDQGHTWISQRSSPDEILTSIAFASPQSGLAVGCSLKKVPLEATILRTDDGGQTWKLQNTAGVQCLNSVAFAPPQ